MSAQTTADQIFEPIENDPLAEQIAAQIEDHILNGLLKQGAQLPGERELAGRLAVSRPKLREGLRLLETRGLLRIVAGEGAFIAELSAPAMSPALIDLFIRHPAARLAAERATPEDRARIAAIVEAMAAAHDPSDAERAADLDSAFHMAIVEASYNRTLIHTMTALYALNRSTVFFSRMELLTSDAVSRAVLDQHRAIAAAIIGGDAEAAAERAVEHIDFVRVAIRDALAERDRRLLSQKRRVAQIVEI